MRIETILKREEGFRSRPYLCTEGYVTVGLGTKLHSQLGQNPMDFPITVSLETAEEWLRSKVAVIDMRLSKSKYGFAYDQLGDKQRVIVLSMAYQMGTEGVLKFEKMWEALISGDNHLAAQEAMDSRWARQTPERAERHARVLRGESFESVYFPSTD